MKRFIGDFRKVREALEYESLVSKAASAAEAIRTHHAEDHP